MTYRMTDEAMREAIAGVMGWTLVQDCWGENPSCGMYEPVPDYPADLNAIREAVCVLSERLQAEFNTGLHWVIFIKRKPLHKLTATDWSQLFCLTAPCSCGCGRTIWKCHEAKAREGAR